ncbi:MAG: hypothetical protein P4M11_15375 [Candidatus Pacebacteria bacterium]|nr:hypothetical protein [Candidatus Paceibacterota bacterium]
MGFSLITLIVFLPLLIFHMIYYDGSLGSFCDDVYPCFTYFSSFPSSYAIGYSSTILGFIVMALICSVFRWVRFYSDNARYKFFDSERIKYSKKLFNWWDWTSASPATCYELQKANFNDLKMILNDDATRLLVEKRTTSESIQLFLLRFRYCSINITIRALFIFINIIVLAVGWAAIAAVYYYEQTIKDYASTVPGLDMVVRFPCAEPK